MRRSTDLPSKSLTRKLGVSKEIDISEQQVKNSRKPPIILLGSVKGGSSKTYNTLALAVEIAKRVDSGDMADVCVIDLDLSATNMKTILEQLVEYTDMLPLDDNKINIHQYIIQSATRKIPLNGLITPVEYPSNGRVSNGKHRVIDFILGVSDSQIRNLFSETRTERYENRVREHEARIILQNLLDQVLAKNYKAILIDMQPGMEGLCHAAIQYLTKSKNVLAKKYDIHLCLCSTNDATQLASNLEWAQAHRDLCIGISSKHLLIKDNLNMMTGKLLIEGTAESYWDEIIRTVASLFKQHDKNGRLEGNFDSITVLAHNSEYLNIVCGPLLSKWPDHNNPKEFEKVFAPYARKLGIGDFASGILP